MYSSLKFRKKQMTTTSTSRAAACQQILTLAEFIGAKTSDQGEAQEAHTISSILKRRLAAHKSKQCSSSRKKEVRPRMGGGPR